MRVVGLEPTVSAWKAGGLTINRYPHKYIYFGYIGDRTQNLQIKSLMLYQLSYVPFLIFGYKENRTLLKSTKNTRKISKKFNYLL